MWESMHIDGVPPGLGGGMVEAEMNENNGSGGADDAIETSAGGGGGRSAQNANYVVENPTIDLEIYVQGLHAYIFYSALRIKLCSLLHYVSYDFDEYFTFLIVISKMATLL